MKNNDKKDNGKIFKFYNGTKDAAFKEVFLVEKNWDLLEAVIETVIGEKVKVEKTSIVELLDGNVKVKRKRIDAKVIATGKILQVEINTEKDKDYYRIRNMGYISNEYSKRVLSGKIYDDKTEVTQINISTNINNKELIRKYTIRDENGNQFVNNFNIYEVNLSKMKKLCYNKTDWEKYKYLIMLALNEDELLKIEKGRDKLMDKYVKEIFEKNSDPAFQEYMSQEEDEEKMINTRIYNATQQGIEEGIEEGTNQKAIETAKKMLDKKYDIKDISDISGLSVKEIESLK